MNKVIPQPDKEPLNLRLPVGEITPQPSSDRQLAPTRTSTAPPPGVLKPNRFLSALMKSAQDPQKSQPATDANTREDKKTGGSGGKEGNEQASPDGNAESVPNSSSRRNR
jgi:hypothetical protein